MFGATYLGGVIQIIPEGTVPLTLFQVLLLLLILVCFLHYLIFNKERFQILGIELELLLILTLISFSIIYSPNRESALLNLSRIIFLIIMVYVIVNLLKERKHFYAIFFLMTFMAVILGSLSVHAALLDPFTAVMNLRYGGTRIIGRGAITIEDPNVFATLFFLPIAFTTSIFLSQTSILKRSAALGVTLVLLAGLASTYSRSAWIASAVLLMMLVIYYKQYKMMGLTACAIIIIILAVPELRDLTVGMFNRLLDIFAGSADDSSKIRMMLGIAAMHMFFDSYMLGVGFRGFPEMFTNYFSTQKSIGVVEPHNVIYEILAELGVIGFGLFLLLMIAIYRVAASNIRRSTDIHNRVIATALISTLTAFLIFYQFYGGGLMNTNLWATIGLIFAQRFYLNRPGSGI